MLLELAIGDAYGAGFEYVETEMIRQQNNLSHYVKHPRHGIQSGYYTDDTQMSLAIAEAIISGGPWKPAQHSYRYLLRFSSDRFPESEGPPEGKHGTYYDPLYLDYYGWKSE